jgi:hypothetical protein
MSMVVASVIADDKTKFDEYSPHPWDARFAFWKLLAAAINPMPIDNA